MLTPTRELAAQILEDLNDLAVHTPVTGASVFGGVGMAPQEHAFRSGVDVLVATPGRLLDHFRYPYAKLTGLEVLVLDEADRMLDMGFLPEIRKILRHLPTRRQTLFFSATMPDPIIALTRDMLRDPVTINLARRAAPAVGITQAVYPVPQELKAALFLALLAAGRNPVRRWSSPAPSIEPIGLRSTWSDTGSRRSGFTATGRNPSGPRRWQGSRAGSTASSWPPTSRPRGIDIEALGHVVNFDVPKVPEDYIHRVGRTARAEAVGDAFTFVAPDEEEDLRRIERALGKRLPRVIVPDFGYTAKVETRLEVPLGERIAAIRAKKAEDRARSAAKANARPTHRAPEHGRRGPRRKGR